MARFFAVSVTLAMISCAFSGCVFARGVGIVYDFVDRYPDAKVSNALNPGAQPMISGGVRKRAVFLHPTVGDTTAEYSVRLPKVKKGERFVFMYSAGLRDGLKTSDPEHPFDGVEFELRVDGKKEFSASLTQTRWIDGALDLTSKSGKQVKFVFVTRPNENSNYDWSGWGEPQILRLSTSILSRDGTAQTAKGIVTASASATGGSLRIIPVDQSGAAIGDGVVVEVPKGRLTAARFDFTPQRAASVRVTVSDMRPTISDVVTKDLGVYAFDPNLEIISFGPTSAIVFGDRPAEFRCVIRNVGEGTLDEAAGARAILSIAPVDPARVPPTPTGRPSQPPSKPLGTIFPGEEKTIVWESQTLPTASGVQAQLSIVGKGLEGLTTTSVFALSVRPGDLGPPAEKVQSRQFPDGSVALDNSKLRVLFLRSPAGFTGWTLSIPKDGAWEQVAAGAPLGKLVTQDASNGAVPYNLYPSIIYPTVARPDGASVVLYQTRRLGSSACKFKWTFSLDAEEPRLSVAQSMVADTSLAVLHFSGPTIYVGDGGFRSQKDEALFPGLEYLLTERSSGTENAGPPHNLRTVPHPNKVTIPLMAVRSGKTLVTLEWDPLQKWDGQADRPSAVFASPNFLDGQENHLMGLFAPSVPDWTPENRLAAENPYILAEGKSIRLAADITVLSDSPTVLDAVTDWLARHGVPDPPPMSKKPHEMMDLCDQAFLGPTWDPTAKAWKHTNTGPVYFDPMIATYLWNRANRIYDQDKSRRLLEPTKAAVEAAKDRLDLDIALLAGGVQAALQRLSDRVGKLIADQGEDGSWPFAPDKAHEVFGKPGDSSSGWSARYAATILRYALIAGDAKAREAGLKALKYLDTQSRPEGAQTWELQLHVPDILASARLVNAYLSGYQLTDDEEYLHKAVYWAKSGLPFVYLWNAPDRPIMLYGTIPVFGVTWFDIQPWFGVCVQWCGLDYAYSIAKLADFDDSLPWEKIARGILYCGIQQQEYITEQYPSDIGMYPDAYSPIKGKEEYHWDLNPRLIARGILRSFRGDGFPSTYTVTDTRGEKLTLTIPVQGAKLVREPDELVLDFSYAAGPTIHAVLSGVVNPRAASLNEELLSLVADVEKVEEGWQYIPERKMAIFKLRPQFRNQLRIDMFEHNIRPEHEPEEN